MPSTDIKDYWRRSWGIGDRVGFKDGPVLKGESLKIHLEEFVKNFKIKNNRFPSIVEIRDGAKASTKSIRTYLTEGKDFTVMSRAESAKLGGDTTGAQTKGTIFNISADLQNKVDSTKLRGANLYIDSTKTGSKSLILQITDPKLKGNFFDGKNSLSLPATEKNFKKFKKKLKTIENSKLYKKTIVPYKSDEKKLAEKKGKYYQLKKGDPHHVQKKLAKVISEKGVKEIHHSRFKADPQTLEVMMLVDPALNNVKNLKDAEAIRNKLQTEHKRILKSNQPLEVKQKSLNMVNAKLVRLKNSLRNTSAAGLLDVKIITMNDAGKITTTFKGADISKSIGWETESGKKDLTTVKKKEVPKIIDEIVNKNFKNLGLTLNSDQVNKAKTFLRSAMNKGQNIFKFVPNKFVRKGGGAALAVLDYSLFHHLFGVPQTEALIAAGGWLTKNDVLGKQIIATSSMAGIMEEDQPKNLSELVGLPGPYKEDDEVGTERLTEMAEVMKVPERKASSGLSGVDQYIINRHR